MKDIAAGPACHMALLAIGWAALLCAVASRPEPQALLSSLQSGRSCRPQQVKSLGTAYSYRDGEYGEAEGLLGPSHVAPCAVVSSDCLQPCPSVPALYRLAMTIVAAVPGWDPPGSQSTQGLFVFYITSLALAGRALLAC
jgi:hypothetical protein